jgi:hypothetical protein
MSCGVLTAGNHETMNVAGRFTYATQPAMAEFLEWHALSRLDANLRVSPTRHMLHLGHHLRNLNRRCSSRVRCQTPQAGVCALWCSKSMVAALSVAFVMHRLLIVVAP